MSTCLQTKDETEQKGLFEIQVKPLQLAGSRNSTAENEWHWEVMLPNSGSDEK